MTLYCRAAKGKRRAAKEKCHGEAIASPNAAHLPAAEHSIDHLHGAAKNPDARRTIMALT